ncbi:lysine-rich nucleolar protein 1 isoform X2 [Nannospalax galili]|uniref:lysine-rich nucleolar protein 1 isoform X2 n=1 Tax=Nannospalax galili TaxID=1026970 RepID=UPI0004ED56AD|nr:lysine-rich nucleolar protein 1 isoform X2 [Nannospalax galili]
MDAISTATARPRPGRRRPSRERARSSKLTSGSRQSSVSRGGRKAWSVGASGMVTKTQKVELDLSLPEKKKKRKKKVVVAVIKDPETQYSVLNSNDCFVDVSLPRATSLSNDMGKEQVPEMPLSKKKKKKKGHGTLFEEPEPMTWAGQTKSPSPRRQALNHLECLSGEKKKNRMSLPQATQGLGAKAYPKQGEEVSKAGKKLKKHKEKKIPDAATPSSQDSWLCEAGDALYPCSRESEAEVQAALGQKRKQGSPRKHSMKKKKKTHPEGDALPVHSKPARYVENSPKKGSKKKPVKDEVLEYTPVDSREASGKKKGKSKKKVEELVGEGPAVKRKKKKKKRESGATDNSWEQEKEEVRRKALQEEIDRESGKTEASEPRKWTGTQFGQWDTAGFENEEQKLKFLKLMGGFKHLSPSFSRPPSMTGRPNMALDKKSADTLQQNLQQDYDRAMSWKYSRGAGLGFSSATDKIFYIDRNASKSIKLQD